MCHVQKDEKSLFCSKGMSYRAEQAAERVKEKALCLNQIKEQKTIQRVKCGVQLFLVKQLETVNRLLFFK